MHTNNLNEFLDYMSHYKNFSYQSHKRDLFIYMSDEGCPIDKMIEQIVCKYVERNNRSYFSLQHIRLNHDNRGKGIFRQIINYMESMNTPVMVENIINPLVRNILLKRGWMEYRYYYNGGIVLSMIK